MLKSIVIGFAAKVDWYRGTRAVNSTSSTVNESINGINTILKQIVVNSHFFNFYCKYRVFIANKKFV